MRNQILMAATMLVLLTAPAFAQQEAGDTELQAQGTLYLVTSGDFESSGAIFVNYGRFFNQNQEIGVLAVGTFNDEGDLKLSGGPFYRYNFLRGNVAPYVGAAAKFGESPYSDDITLTFEGGARFFLSRSTAFSVAANTDYSIDEQELADTIQVVFGFSYLWGR
ncbi:MAG TPA: hypothetical protein VJ725_14795 [Thermoanaerobaculia bacterium]|nr:hypothetical protein [Thermoanaerobaculia bacterium]